MMCLRTQACCVIDNLHREPRDVPTQYQLTRQQSRPSLGHVGLAPRGQPLLTIKAACLTRAARKAPHARQEYIYGIWKSPSSKPLSIFLAHLRQMKPIFATNECTRRNNTAREEPCCDDGHGPPVGRDPSSDVNCCLCG